jgi:hypothetical protein
VYKKQPDVETKSMRHQNDNKTSFGNIRIENYGMPDIKHMKSASNKSSKKEKKIKYALVIIKSIEF